MTEAYMLKFKGFTGEFSLTLDESTNFGVIRTQVAENQNLAIEDFELSFQGHELGTKDTPKEHNFQSGTVIEVTESRSRLARKAQQQGARSTELKITQILLDEPVGTVEMLEIEKNLMRPPLYADVNKIVPMIPLFNVGTRYKRYECCEKYVKCNWFCWNVVFAILCYPFAVTCHRCIYCVGYMIYYWFLVPVRNFISYCFQPCVEAYWTCVQPLLVCLVVCGKGCLRPCPEVYGGCIGDCFNMCCDPCSECCWVSCGPGCAEVLNCSCCKSAITVSSKA